MHLFPINLAIAICVDVRNDAPHGITRPNPNTMQLQHQQTSHANNVAKPRTNKAGY